MKNIGDDSQDALLVRVAADGLVGFGEFEAVLLQSIASLPCSMTLNACKPVAVSVRGYSFTATGAETLCPIPHVRA